jgi:hypothetical protein
VGQGAWAGLKSKPLGNVRGVVCLRSQTQSVRTRLGSAPTPPPHTHSLKLGREGHMRTYLRRNHKYIMATQVADAVPSRDAPGLVPWQPSQSVRQEFSCTPE